MKTSMPDLIEKLNELQNHIIDDSEYAKGYDSALRDCINVAESYLQKEKEINTEILEMLIRISEYMPESDEIKQLIKKATL